jgi:signal transduction histidine kinase
MAAATEAPGPPADVAAGPVTNRTRIVVRAVVALAGVALVVVTADGHSSSAVVAALVAVGLYLLASTLLGWTPAARARTRGGRTDVVRALLDVAAVCTVAAATADARGAVLLLLCTIPLGYGLTLSSRAIGRIAAVAVAGCLGVGLVSGVLVGDDPSPGFTVVLALSVAWSGLVAVLIAGDRERRAQRINRLSVSVRAMLGQAMEAEANERTRVADLLHDDVLQLLLTSRHDLADAIDGDHDLLPEVRAGLDAATRRLRDTIVALRDEGVDDEAVGVALRGLADDPTATRCAVTVVVDPAVEELRHPLLLATARDLLRDAASGHAARAVSIDASRDADDLVLVLRHDDPRATLGLGPAADGGTVADVRARVHALDGTLEVATAGDGARTVTVRLADGGSRTRDLDPAPLPRPAGSR